MILFWIVERAASDQVVAALLGAIFGALATAIAGHVMPRAFTAKKRARRAARHIQWAWEDYWHEVDRAEDNMRTALKEADERLKARGLLESNLDVPERRRVRRHYIGVVSDAWRKAARKVDDIDDEIGWIEKLAGYRPIPETVSPTGQDQMFTAGLDRIRNLWEPPPVVTDQG